MTDASRILNDINSINYANPHGYVTFGRTEVHSLEATVTSQAAPWPWTASCFAANNQTAAGNKKIRASVVHSELAKLQTMAAGVHSAAA